MQIVHRAITSFVENMGELVLRIRMTLRGELPDNAGADRDGKVSEPEVAATT